MQISEVKLERKSLQLRTSTTAEQRWSCDSSPDEAWNLTHNKLLPWMDYRPKFGRFKLTGMSAYKRSKLYHHSRVDRYPSGYSTCNRFVSRIIYWPWKSSSSPSTNVRVTIHTHTNK